MSNKDYKQRKKERQAQAEIEARKQVVRSNTKKVTFIFAVIAAIIIIAVLVMGHVIPTSFGGNNGFTPPQNGVWGQFLQVSTSDYASAGHENIYFVSWIGCPVGAADSWALYGAFNQYYSGIQSSVYGHTSDPNEGALANIPGLIFTSQFSFTHNGVNVSFTPLYLYNETMFGEEGSNYANPEGNGILITTSSQNFNIAPSSSKIVQYGLSIASANLPPSIYQVYDQFETVYPVSNVGSGTHASDNLTEQPHLTTIMIITDSKGTFVFNGPMYNPQYLTSQGYSYQYLLQNYNSISDITSAMNQFDSYIL